MSPWLVSKTLTAKVLKRNKKKFLKKVWYYLEEKKKKCNLDLIRRTHKFPIIYYRMIQLSKLHADKNKSCDFFH